MNKIIIRVFLLLSIGSILVWLITSNYGFIFLAGTRGAELPEWIKSLTPIARAIFTNLTFQLFYWLIALGLFIEFLYPKIELKWNENLTLTTFGFISILDGLWAIAENGIAVNFKDGWYDTMFYGIGFGLLFLVRINPNSAGMKIVLWTRLIEIGGFFLGFLYIPAALGIWTGGGNHLAHGLLFMLTDKFFWSDFLVQILSFVWAIYYLLKSKTHLFWTLWVVFFTIGSIVVGLFLGVGSIVLFAK